MSYLYLLICGTLALTINTTVNLIAGPPATATSSVSSSPSTVFADGSAQASITIIARDAFGNLSPNASLTLATSGGNMTLGATTGATDANGRFVTTLTSTQVQTPVVTATFASGANPNGQAAFVAGPASAAASTLSISPASQTADGNATIVATLSVLDAKSRPMAGRVASFTASGSTTTISAAAATDVTGATSATYKTTLAQNQNILVTVDGLSFVAPVTFVAGPAVAAQSSLALNPNKMVADGNASAQVLVTARDAQRNLTAGTAIALSASGGNTTFVATSGTTNASGQFTTTLSSTQAQTETIAASLNTNSTVSATLTLVAGPASASTTTLTTARYTTLANNSNVTTATLRLADVYNNPISGQAASWSTTGSGITLAANGNTSSTGIATATLKTATVQNANVTVTSQGLSLVATTRFVANPNSCAITLDTNQQTADGNSAINITVYVADASQTGMVGQAISFYVTGTSGPLTYSAVKTNASGYATNALRSTTTGPSLITVRAGNLRCKAPVTFVQKASYCALNPNYTVTRFTTTSSVNDFSLGDINNDGIVDIVTINSNNTINTYLGTGTGTFGAATSSPTTGTTSSFSLNDVDADGFLDVIYQDTTNAVTVTAVGNGNGTFVTTASTASYYGTLQASIYADFDGDGLVDRIENAYGTRTIAVGQGTGRGGFAPGVSQNAYGSYDMALGDIDGDGDLDLVTANRLNGAASVFIGSGLGSFANFKNYSTSGYTQHCTIADFNNDGYPDVAVTNVSQNNFATFLSQGDGTLGAATFLTTGSGPQTIWAADLNGDGINDLLVQAGTKQLTVYPGSASGVFNGNTIYATSNSYGRVRFADLNKDGYQDIVLDTGGAGLDVWLYSGCH